MAAVLVHIDLDGAKPHPSSLAALAAGRLVASSWGATLYAALIIRDVSEPAAGPDSTVRVLTTAKIPGVVEVQHTLARAGADKIVVALCDVPVTPLWASVGTAWQGVLDHLRPRLVLFGADAASASELAPRTGAKIGARLLLRARPVGIEDVELRDRDGGYVRASDGGAAVVLVGHAPQDTPGEQDVDVIVLALPGGADERIEATGAPAAPAASDGAQTCGTIVVIGEDVSSDETSLGHARAIAAKLGAQLVTMRGAVVAGDARLDTVERHAALAPELCVQLGAVTVDVSGSASLVRIGAGGKTLDGAVPGAPGPLVAELAKLLGAIT